MDCPSGVDIPRYMSIYNQWKTFGLESWAKAELSRIPKEKRSENCNDCGQCEDKCPNKLPIRVRFKELAAIG